MARFEKKGTDGTKNDAGLTPGQNTSRPRSAARAKEAPSIEDTMFFTRLRRHTKWMFWFLAILIGGGLVIAGVGAGGVGVLDVFRGGGGSGTSISSARDKTEKNPEDVQAWRDLALAYQTDLKAAEATTALERASALRPKDTSILRDLAAAQLDLATQKQRDAQLAQFQGAYAAPTDPALGFQVGGQNALGTDKLTAAIAARYTARLSAAYSAASSAAASSVATYKKIVALEPDDPNVQLELAQAAESAGDTATAIAAYKTFVRLAPDDSSVSLVKDRLEQLQPKPTPSTNKGTKPSR